MSQQHLSIKNLTFPIPWLFQSAESTVPDSAAEPDRRPIVQVRANATGATLRRGPTTSEGELQLDPGAFLCARDTLDKLQPRIGQPGQWLPVCTLRGDAGVVDAQYISLIGVDTPAKAIVTPDLIAQATLLAANDFRIANVPGSEREKGWLVAAGAPLQVIEPGNWSQKLTDPNATLRVRSYAFKEGTVKVSQLRVPRAADQRPAASQGPVPKSPPWLYGIHDPFDRTLFDGTGKTGWVMIPERLSIGGKPVYKPWADAGYGVIARLSFDDSELGGAAGTVPTPDQYADFANRCAAWAKVSPNCRVFVIGNEMNNPREWPGAGADKTRAITPRRYADCFNQARAAIKAVRPDAAVVPGALHPFQSPDLSCLDWFTQMLGSINDLDGLALHTFTHGNDAGLITNMQQFGDDPLKWQYYHFRAYTTLLDVVPEKWRRKPVFITSAAPADAQPWAGGQNGWVRAAYDEIARWNAQPHAQQIQALILYRWNGDSGWGIANKPAIRADFKAAVQGGQHSWRG